MDQRKNIPTAEFQAVVQPEQQSPIRVAYERRNRDLDPQLVWRGEGEQGWSDLVIHATALYIQEKVHPKALIDDLLRQAQQREKEVSDVDGNSERRSDTVSVFNGPPPLIRKLKSERDEFKAIGDWLTKQLKAGLRPEEIGLFVRSSAELDRAVAATNKAGMPFTILDDHVETAGGHMAIATMHLAKGLEFRAVAVMACDDEVIPSQDRIQSVGDDADLQEVYDTERQLLYVACTRARDHLLVTGVEPASEFLDDLGKI
jgi:superfamily I DNA/RNA helicase